MGNAVEQRGEVDIELDRPRIIRLTTLAVARAEKMLDHSLLNNSPRNMGFNEVLTLLFVGLQHEDKDLTLERAGELFDDADKAMVMEAVFKAWGLLLKRGTKKEEPGDPLMAASGPGTAS